MRHDELMALPDVTAKIEPQDRMTDGKMRRVSVQVGWAGVLWREENEPAVYEDATGRRWEVGRKDGVMVRRQATGWSRL